MFVMSVNTVNQKGMIYANHGKGIGTQVDGAFIAFMSLHVKKVYIVFQTKYRIRSSYDKPLACAHHGVSKIQVDSGDAQL